MILTRRTAVALGLFLGFSLGTVGPAAAADDPAPPQAPPPQAAAQPQVEPQFPRTYGPLDASREAYERGEARRRGAIQRQIELNDEMVWYSGHPGFERVPPGLDTIYAYGHTYPGRPGPRATVRLGHFGYYGYPATRPYPRCGAGWFPPWGVFEPWPLVPGDVWGYPYVDRVEHPLGHKVIRTGPNGYIARPVYASDLEQREEEVADAGQAAEAGPVVPEPLPPPPAEGRPREF